MYRHACYDRCATTLIDGAKERGVDTTVHCADPGWSPYDQGFFQCPHRRRYWLRPTQRQVNEWTRRGIR